MGFIMGSFLLALISALTAASAAAGYKPVAGVFIAVASGLVSILSMIIHYHEKE